MGIQTTQAAMDNKAVASLLAHGEFMITPQIQNE
jgi:hypothetical protein